VAVVADDVVQAKEVRRVADEAVDRLPFRQKDMDLEVHVSCPAAVGGRLSHKEVRGELSTAKGFREAQSGRSGSRPVYCELKGRVGHDVLQDVDHLVLH